MIDFWHFFLFLYTKLHNKKATGLGLGAGSLASSSSISSSTASWTGDKNSCASYLGSSEIQASSRESTCTEIAPDTACDLPVRALRREWPAGAPPGQLRGWASKCGMKSRLSIGESAEPGSPVPPGTAQPPGISTHFCEVEAKRFSSSKPRPERTAQTLLGLERRSKRLRIFRVRPARSPTKM